MGSASLPSNTFCSKKLLNSSPLIFEANHSSTPSLKLRSNNKYKPQTAYASSVVLSTLSQPGLIWSRDSLSSGHMGLLSLGAFGTENPRSGEEDHRALETVLKLHAAIKNRNISELSDVICEECRCFCSFFSTFQPLYGKKQILDFFSSLMSSLGNNIEFKVQPMSRDGMSIIVSWKLECKKTHVPLGKGLSFYMCHAYHGKVVIRNVEMFMEPFPNTEPLRLKILAFLTTVMDKMGKAKRRGVYTLLTLFFMGLSLLFLKLSLC